MPSRSAATNSALLSMNAVTLPVLASATRMPWTQSAGRHSLHHAGKAAVWVSVTYMTSSESIDAAQRAEVRPLVEEGAVAGKVFGKTVGKVGGHGSESLKT